MNAFILGLNTKGFTIGFQYFGGSIFCFSDSNKFEEYKNILKLALGGL